MNGFWLAHDALVAWLSHGVLAASWWQIVIFALVATHITIAAVTIYLHRSQAHRALELHPVVSHFFRFWLWLTTGMVTKEWVAIHRKHHAKCETVDDPHSPVTRGIKTVLFTGAELYRAESKVQETMVKYGHNTPDDWIERNLYTRYSWQGVGLMLVIDLFLFGAIGAAVWALQMAWIPITAAGIINGLGHWWGYRNFEAADASTNISPWGIIIGGEELHNNHHTYPTSAKLSVKPHEFDIGWMYIRIMEMFGLAHVRHFATIPRIDPHKTACDTRTIETLVHNRYYVLARYTRAVRKICRLELARLKRGTSPESKVQLDPHTLWNFRRWLRFNSWDLRARRPIDLTPVLKNDPLLQTIYSMRGDLSKLWARSTASTDQLVEQLRDWCRRAEASGIDPLRQFSRDIVRLT
jgi:stearoyl-CoA desaturase (delta-9 desaturase)